MLDYCQKAVTKFFGLPRVSEIQFWFKYRLFRLARFDMKPTNG